jgi:hypothetical protein
MLDGDCPSLALRVAVKKYLAVPLELGKIQPIRPRSLPQIEACLKVVLELP